MLFKLPNCGANPVRSGFPSERNVAAADGKSATAVQPLARLHELSDRGVPSHKSSGSDWLIVPPDPVVDLSCQVLVCRAPELRVAHYSIEDVIIALHPLDEEVIKDSPKKGGKIGLAIRLGSFHDLFVPLGSGAHRVEEELVRLGEVSTEPFIQLKLFASRLLSTPWLLHLDVFRGQLNPATLGGRSRPDLVGQDASGSWYAFETKGRSSVPSSEDKEKAKEQAQRLVSVDGSACALHIGSFAFFRGDELEFYWRDPEPEEPEKLEPIEIRVRDEDCGSH